MTSVFKSNILTLSKNNNFKLEINHPKSIVFLRSLLLNDKVSIINESKSVNLCNVTFDAFEVLNLSKFLSKYDSNYKYLVHMFLSLKYQINFLYENKMGISFFDIDDIVVIKNKKNDTHFSFAFLNFNKVFEIQDDFLLVSKSFNKSKKTSFFSPELLTVNTIPFKVFYKCCYFSLATLVAYCIDNKQLDFLNPLDWNNDDFVKILEPIDNTKLFWALLRCHEIDPKNRFLLWI